MVSTLTNLRNSGRKASTGPTYAERECGGTRITRKESRERNEIGYVAREKKWDELYHACEHDLHLWLTEVFPDTTGLKPFGPKQLQAIATTQQVILKGGRFCDAEPRAYAKTIRCALRRSGPCCYGHRRCIPLFGCNQDKAQELLTRFGFR